MFEIRKIYNIDLSYKIYTVIGTGNKENFIKLLSEIKKPVYMYLEQKLREDDTNHYTRQIEKNDFYKLLIKDERLETRLVEVPLKNVIGDMLWQTRLKIELKENLDPFDMIQFF